MVGFSCTPLVGPAPFASRSNTGCQRQTGCVQGRGHDDVARRSEFFSLEEILFRLVVTTRLSVTVDRTFIIVVASTLFSKTHQSKCACVCARAGEKWRAGMGACGTYNRLARRPAQLYWFTFVAVLHQQSPAWCIVLPPPACAVSSPPGNVP